MAAVQYIPNPNQQHMVVQGQPGGYPATYVVQNPDRSEKYNSRRARITGWIQIGGAIACIVFGVIQVGLNSSGGTLAIGIWSGIVFFLPTGIVGVCSQKKNTCVIIAYMVMSIISALTSFTVFALEIAAVVTNSDYYLGPCNFYDFFYSDCESVGRARIAFNSLLALAGLLELVVAIVAACNCCAVVCCGRTNSSTGSPMVFNETPVVMVLQPVAIGGQPMENVFQQLLPANQTQAHYPVAYPQAHA